MEGTRASIWTLALAVLLVIAVLLGVYVGSYFLLGQRFGIETNGRMIFRVYEQDWQVEIYEPLGKVEGALTGADVRVVRSDIFKAIY